MQQIIFAVAACGLLLSSAVGAVTIVQCEDAEGNRTYQEKCPPGSKVVGTKNIYTGPKESGPDMEALQEEYPVVFYSVTDCDACDLVRNYLNNRGIPFSEKSVGDDAELQEELIAKTGQLSVPVVTIGDEIVEGYNKPVLKSKLDEVGYPENPPAQAGAESAPVEE